MFSIKAAPGSEHTHDKFMTITYLNSWQLEHTSFEIMTSNFQKIELGQNLKNAYVLDQI